MTPDPFVLNLAPTGMVPTREMTPHVPLAPDEVGETVGACLEHGVTVVHVHARGPDGRPTSSPERYAEIIRRVREGPDVVVCVSCSGRIEPDFESRAAVLDLDGDLRPEMASLTLSSMNFSREASVNDPATVVRLAERMRERGIKPELEVFDVGMVNFARYMIRKGHLEPPFYFNVLLGNIASAQLNPLHLGTILAELPEGSVWSVAGLGDAQLPANAMALALGGGVRVGLEDNLWIDRDRSRLATNEELVRRIVEVGGLLGRAPMSPSELRRRLGI